MIELFILAAIGSFVHLLFKWNNARKRQQAVFNWEMQIFHTVLSIITACLLIYLRDDLKNIITINRVTAVFLGYVGDSAFKNLVKTFKGKLTNWD